MPSLKNILMPLVEEQQEIEELSNEVEKVLQYYAEHPQYPLDYNKLRKKIREVNSRMAKIREEMVKISTDSF